MALRRNGLEFDGDDILRSIAVFNPRVDAMIAAIMQRQAPRVEAWMKTNAPWTDRTSNARNTLRAIPRSDGDQHEIFVTGGMPYQIYLETRWSGRYAILQPAMLHWGPILMSNLNGLIDRLGRR